MVLLFSTIGLLLAPNAFAQSEVKIEAPFGAKIAADGSIAFYQVSEVREGAFERITEEQFKRLKENLSKNLGKTLCRMQVMPKSVGVSLGAISVDWDMAMLCREANMQKAEKF